MHMYAHKSVFQRRRCTCTCVCVCVCVFLGGVRWMLLDFHGYAWIFNDFHGLSWIYMDFDGFQRLQEHLGDPLGTSCGAPGRLLGSSLGWPLEVPECKLVHKSTVRVFKIHLGHPRGTFSIWLTPFFSWFEKLARNAGHSLLVSCLSIFWGSKCQTVLKSKGHREARNRFSTVF